MFPSRATQQEEYIVAFSKLHVIELNEVELITISLVVV